MSNVVTTVEEYIMILGIKFSIRNGILVLIAIACILILILFFIFKKAKN